MGGVCGVGDSRPYFSEIASICSWVSVSSGWADSAGWGPGGTAAQQQGGGEQESGGR